MLLKGVICGVGLILDIQQRHKDRLREVAILICQLLWTITRRGGHNEFIVCAHGCEATYGILRRAGAKRIVIVHNIGACGTRISLIVGQGIEILIAPEHPIRSAIVNQATLHTYATSVERRGREECVGGGIGEGTLRGNNVGTWGAIIGRWEMSSLVLARHSSKQSNSCDNKF